MKNWKDVSALFVIAIIYLVLELVFGITCPILFLTGISCAGCGMSRAWFCMLRLDIAKAFQYHPLFWLLPIMAIAFFCWNKIPKKIQTLLLTAMIFLFLAVYICRLLNPEDTIVVFQPENGLIFSLISKLFIKR